MRTPIPHWPGDLVSLGDTQVYVREAPGDGEPALYVHGLAGAATNWTDLMGDLSDVVDGAAIDLPGFGYSPPPPDGDYTLRAHARAVVRLIEARAGGPVHLFGNSLGGAVATRVAGRRPDLVRTLTLVSPALPDLRPRSGSSRILAATVPGLGPWAMRRLAALPPERRVQASLDMTFADPTRVAPERLMELVAEIRRRDALDHAMDAVVGSARGVITEFLLRGPGSLWRDAARVAAPTLLLYGRDDRIVDPRMAARAGRVFRNARVVTLPDVGHVAQMEKPEIVAREFRTLLADLPARTS
ncbi:MAG: hydrolase, alpha [Actinomycetia bacterium]|jgi:pimeloyl-ACP methyl ester carboxylesterase|nr:hydrolase, alpha [Actinomycetes bacterium]